MALGRPGIPMILAGTEHVVSVERNNPAASGGQSGCRSVFDAGEAEIEAGAERHDGHAKGPGRSQGPAGSSTSGRQHRISCRTPAERWPAHDSDNSSIRRARICGWLSKVTEFGASRTSISCGKDCVTRPDGSAVAQARSRSRLASGLPPAAGSCRPRQKTPH